MSPRAVLFDMLTGRVRLATTAHLAAATGLPAPIVGRRLRGLHAGGWVESNFAAVRRPVLTAPLVTWQPGDGRPNFYALAHRLDTRWASAEPIPSRLWWASALAVAEYGGTGGRIRQPAQVEHDLAVTDVFTRLGWPTNWRGEDLFENDEFGTKVPDAMVADAAGRVTVIEIGGQYSAARLRAFHEAMVKLDLPYHLW